MTAVRLGMRIEDGLAVRPSISTTRRSDHHLAMLPYHTMTKADHGYPTNVRGISQERPHVMYVMRLQ